MSGPDDGAAASGDSFRQVKDICLRRLAARPRTRAELRDAVARKGFDGDVIEQVLDKLEAARLIDDADFAATWVRSRQTHQGLGRRALRAELLRKGVSKEIADEVVSGVDEGDEEARARALVRKKLPSLQRVDSTTALRRVVAMLARKGYPEGLSYTVASEELGVLGERGM
ncbi:regulatory protein RecX [Haloechinothrix sp. YIM 98757]|uniref:Regulatory protein RecX n=1 Tax=Haloechinothrix aidingensis TaxID=2752311 RepID=A0A838A9W2_9PSEU|nr:regulatory protein RecX [Haloechinothrix aidingensis]MBA0125671.1 regulatory protein RecX [Haloechinothrix aidingensis]